MWRKETFGTSRWDSIYPLLLSILSGHLVQGSARETSPAPNDRPTTSVNICTPRDGFSLDVLGLPTEQFFVFDRNDVPNIYVIINFKYLNKWSRGWFLFKTLRRWTVNLALNYFNNLCPSDIWSDIWSWFIFFNQDSFYMINYIFVLCFIVVFSL